MKIIKGTITSVSKIKEVCKTLLEQIKGIPKEIQAIQDAVKAF